MLEEIDLSLSALCNAKCVFCPRSQHEPTVKFMPVELVERIVKEITSDTFKAKHQVVLSHIGENGEASLHPNLIEVLRILKAANISIDLYTNFSALTEHKLEVIFRENLIQSFHTNIDGLTPESYEVMKGLNYKTVTDNLEAFLELRESHPATIAIHIITAEMYATAVQDFFGVWPHALPEDYEFIPQEAELIKKHWEPKLRPGDGLGISNVLMWGERNHTRRKPGHFPCFNSGRIQRAAFIAPSGDWYICCFDIANELVLGNLYKNTIDEIYESDRRKEVLQLLQQVRYYEVGLPCSRVDCCQVV